MENIVNLNEDEIFKTLQICQVIKGSHMGVLCIGTFNMIAYMKLKQFSNNVHNMIVTAYKMRIPLIGYEYYGKVPEQYVTQEVLTDMEDEYKVIKSKRTIRKESSLIPILNFMYPNLNYNSVELLNGFTYSEPFVKYKNQIVCVWKPLHQDLVTQKNFTIKDNCLVYTFHKPIYILTTDAKRHVATEFSELFIINLNTLRVTRECNYINSDSAFVQGRYNLDNGIWKAVKQQSKHIMGSKTHLDKMVV